MGWPLSSMHCHSPLDVGHFLKSMQNTIQANSDVNKWRCRLVPSGDENRQTFSDNQLVDKKNNRAAGNDRPIGNAVLTQGCPIDLEHRKTGAAAKNIERAGHLPQGRPQLPACGKHRQGGQASDNGDDKKGEKCLFDTQDRADCSHQFDIPGPDPPQQMGKQQEAKPNPQALEAEQQTGETGMQAVDQQGKDDGGKGDDIGNSTMSADRLRWR